MPKAWQDNITTTWFKAAFLYIFYNHINPLGLKVQPLINIAMESVQFIYRFLVGCGVFFEVGK